MSCLETEPLVAAIWIIVKLKKFSQGLSTASDTLSDSANQPHHHPGHCCHLQGVALCLTRLVLTVYKGHWDTACPQLIVSSSSQNTGTQSVVKHNNGNPNKSLVPIMGPSRVESWPTPRQSSAEGHITVSVPLGRHLSGHCV